MLKLRFLLFLLPMTLSGCGVIGPKLDFYDSDSVAKESGVATISGSKIQGRKPLSPILVFIDSIDKKVTGRAKEQRCSFKKQLPILPGKHELVVVIAVGEPFASSRVSAATVQINVLPGAKLSLRGEAYSNFAGAVWVEDMNGFFVTEKLAVTLKDSPSKGMPIGFAAIEDACSLP